MSACNAISFMVWLHVFKLRSVQDELSAVMGTSGWFSSAAGLSDTYILSMCNPRTTCFACPPHMTFTSGWS